MHYSIVALFGGERVLVVQNLSSQPQTAEISVAPLSSGQVIDLLGATEFPISDDGLLRVAPALYGFYWLLY
jgi:hypothetical protein